MDFRTIDITAEVLESFNAGTRVEEGVTRRLNFDSVEETSLLGRVFSFFRTFAGFIVEGVQIAYRAIQWTAVAAASLIVQVGQTLYALDWAMSDDQIDQMLRAQSVSLAAVLGDFVGATGARLVGLTLVGGLTLKFPAFGAALFATLLEDTGDEVSARVAGLLYTAAYASSLALIYGGLKFGKWWLRRWGLAIPRGSERWTEENMSLAAVFERFAESLPIMEARVFVENALDSAVDETFEVIMVLAGGVDEFIASQRAGGQPVTMGPERAVRVTPDERSPGEQIVIRGAQDLVVQQLDSITYSHGLLWNRDVGAIVGEPIEEAILRRPQSLRIMIQYRSVPRPPWVDRNGQRARSVTYTVPNLRRSALDWNLIKTAAGGDDGYTWGPFRASCVTSSGSKIAVYGASAGIAEQRIRQLLTLSEDTISTLSISEEKTEGVKLENPSLIKRPTQVYPAYLSIYNRADLLQSAQTGRERLQSRSAARARIPLWVPVKPPDADRIIQEMLRRGTTRGL